MGGWDVVSSSILKICSTLITTLWIHPLGLCTHIATMHSWNVPDSQFTKMILILWCPEKWLLQLLWNGKIFWYAQVFSLVYSLVGTTKLFIVKLYSEMCSSSMSNIQPCIWFKNVQVVHVMNRGVCWDEPMKSFIAFIYRIRFVIIYGDILSLKLFPLIQSLLSML